MEEAKRTGKETGILLDELIEGVMGFDTLHATHKIKYTESNSLSESDLFEDEPPPMKRKEFYYLVTGADQKWQAPFITEAPTIEAAKAYLKRLDGRVKNPKCLRIELHPKDIYGQNNEHKASWHEGETVYIIKNSSHTELIRQVYTRVTEKMKPAPRYIILEALNWGLPLNTVWDS